jgi:hypothetical protein
MDLPVSVLGRSPTTVKEVDPTTAPAMTMTATATPTPSPLPPGDHGVCFSRRRTRRGVATAIGGACGCGGRRHHFELFFIPKLFSLSVHFILPSENNFGDKKIQTIFA